MDAWERMFRDEREALDFLLGEEFGMTAQQKREVERVLAEFAKLDQAIRNERTQYVRNLPGTLFNLPAKSK